MFLGSLPEIYFLNFFFFGSSLFFLCSLQVAVYLPIKNTNAGKMCYYYSKYMYKTSAFTKRKINAFQKEKLLMT